jgi:hypothetical protein
MAESEDDARTRMVTEAGIYVKYGLADKAVEHLEAVARRWPAFADEAWRDFDTLFAPSLAAAAALCGEDIVASFGPNAARDIGRGLARMVPSRIQLVDVGGLRFVEVDAVIGRVAFVPVATGLRRASGLDSFAAVVAEAAPLDGPDDVDGVVANLVDVFERVTGWRVDRAGRSDGRVVIEPPHCLGGLVRFVVVGRAPTVVIDIRVPRVVL